MRILVDVARALALTRFNPLPLALAMSRHGAHFGAALAASAWRFGSRTALIDAVGDVSYDWLWLAATRASGGFTAGERVQLGCVDGRWLVVGVAAASLAGAQVTLVAPGTVGALDASAVRALDGDAPRRRSRPSLTFLTTGTTGAPTPIARNRFRVRQALPAASLLAALGLRPREPVLVLPPLYHGHGFSLVAASLLVGAPVVLGTGSTAVALARAHDVAVVAGVPAQLQSFVGCTLPSVRRFASGSARLSPALAASLLCRAEVVDFFGTTETGTATVATSRDVALGSVGRPAAGVRIRVVDGWVEISSALAPRRGFQRTGDRGHLADGRLYLLGRADGVTVIGGENVSAARLRDYLLAHPDVEHIEVRVLADERLGSVFAVVISPEVPPGLAAAIEGDLGRAYVPVTIEVAAHRASVRE